MAGRCLKFDFDKTDLMVQRTFCYFNYTTLNNANTVIKNRDNINTINRNNLFKDPGFSDIGTLLQKITQRGISFLFNYLILSF